MSSRQTPSVSFTLPGARAVVTGAASGIGLQVARDLIDAGARVVLNDVNGETLHAVAEGLGPDAIAMAGDVTDAGAVETVIGTAAERFGGIDILVNTAGIADEMVPTLEQDLDQWQRVLDVSLRGTYLMSREAGRIMVEAGFGSIVNLSSIAGLVGLPGRNAYSAAKAGIVTMTRNMASEWGRRGVRVNAIAPGYISTPMVDDLMARARIEKRVIFGRTPLGRFGDPREVSNAILFLASPAASYITGTCLSVDGGWVAFGGISLPDEEGAA